MVEKYIPYEYITGEGGLHVFIKLKNNINTRTLLELCYKDNVLFMPGDIFYDNSNDNVEFHTKTDDNKPISHRKKSLKGYDTFRIGFGRVSDENIKKGIAIIGKNIRLLDN